MSERRDQLVGYLKELRLPTIRECFEEMALKAEQESLGLRALSSGGDGPGM